jgi:membrane fusion protein (multidrug efflux system)
MVLLAFFSFFLSVSSRLWGQGDQPLFSVGTIEAALSDFPVRAQYYGLVEGLASVEVYSEVSGRVHRQAFTEGAWIEKGTLLYEIDSQAAGARVQQGEASLSEAQVSLAFAESQLERMRVLREKRAVSGQEYEVAEREKNLAAANLEKAQAVLDQIKAEAALSNVTAPVSGYAGAAQKHEGELVAPGTRETALLTTVEDMGAVKVTFYIPESHVRRYRALAGDFKVDLEKTEFFPAALTIDGEDYPYPGRMSYGSARVEKGTGVMAARAVFPNPELELYSGQAVRIDIEIMTLSNVLAVPQTAIVHGPLGQSLAVLSPDNSVEFRLIEGPVRLGDYFILKNGAGLAPGEKIVVEGLAKIRPGQTVQPRPAQALNDLTQAQPTAD